jgi:uncharacterized protein YwqG
MDALAIGQSRIGGIPDIPHDSEWPSNKNEPLSFVAQINLSELKAYEATRVLPDSGHLLFFYDAQQGVWGFDPADASGFRVMYLDDGDLKRRDFPDKLPRHSRFTPLELSFKQSLSLPPWDSCYVERLHLSDRQTDDYLEMLEEFDDNERDSNLSFLLGHPDQIQGDMQLECALVTNGIYCGDPSGYSDPRVGTLKKGAGSWRLLLQVFSESSAGMMWGDLGCLYYWIHEDDLKAGNFDRVWTILQCS